jgi:anti-sigma-K factor RskA
MTEDDDIDMLAGEYVLGTLEPSMRGVVATRRPDDAALDRAIIAWELRLAPLNALTSSVEPPPGLYAKIEQRVKKLPRARRATVVATTANVIKLERRVATWQRIAGGASALAASLALAVGLGLTAPTVQPAAQTYVAVFQKDDEQPAFLMSIDLKTREVSVRPVTADRQVGKTYQLWIKDDTLGPTPKSLGVLDEGIATTKKSLTGYDAALLQKATFGISVEPAGGSPTGKPTGPALHGFLHPAAP